MKYYVGFKNYIKDEIKLLKLNKPFKAGMIKCYTDNQIDIMLDFISFPLSFTSIYEGPNNNAFRKFIKIDYILHYWKNRKEKYTSWGTFNEGRWEHKHYTTYGVQTIKEFEGQIQKHQKIWDQLTIKHPEFLY